MSGAETRVELIVVTGPTASGKTKIALELAARWDFEVVSADSQQVYEGFDIGTGKPSDAERAMLPHHLISEVNPMTQFSAADFQRRADHAIADIAARGRGVMVVGGTGLYLQALLHGLVSGVKADPEVRARLSAQADVLGARALWQRLWERDPPTAAKVSPHDRFRVIRALEIAEVSGRAPSEVRSEHAFASVRYRHRAVVVDPGVEALKRSIDSRVAGMYASGLADEVRLLVTRGFRDAPAMRSVGYSEALAYTEGRCTLEEAVARTQLRTRQYAKRQRTWFRKQFPGPTYTKDAALDALSASAGELAWPVR